MRAMSSSRWRKPAVALGALGLSLGAAASCSSAEKLSGVGGSCFLVTDCQDGLVCVLENPNQPSGSRICSNNDNAIVPDSMAPDLPDEGIPTTIPVVDAQPVPDALAPSSEGGSPEDATTTPPPPMEASSPPPPMEASTPPPMEASVPIEASAPVEASVPVSDASHD